MSDHIVTEGTPPEGEIMKVKEIMKREFTAIEPDTTIKTAAKILAREDLAALPVVEGKKLKGIVAEGDFLKLIEERYTPIDITILPTPFDYLIELPIRTGLELHEIKRSFDDVADRAVKDIMVKKVITTTPDEDVSEVAFLMHRHHIDQLPVIENGEIVGIIDRSDIIKSIAGVKDD